MTKKYPVNATSLNTDAVRSRVEAWYGYHTGVSQQPSHARTDEEKTGDSVYLVLYSRLNPRYGEFSDPYPTQNALPLGPQLRRNFGDLPIKMIHVGLKLQESTQRGRE